MLDAEGYEAAPDDKNLYWTTRITPVLLPPVLKATIAGRAFDSGDDFAEVDETWIPYLEGVADAGVEGAHELIGAIRHHAVLTLWLKDAPK